jgi:transposase InsO family protein
MPNECWQSDFTHYPLADGTDTEILTWLDDHARYALRVTAHLRVTGKLVLTHFRAAGDENGYPASTLTDNGMVYTVRFATGRGGITAFEAELRARGIVQKNSRPNHPTARSGTPGQPRATQICPAEPPSSAHTSAPDRRSGQGHSSS